MPTGFQKLLKRCSYPIIVLMVGVAILQSCVPDERVVLKQIKDVVVDASSDPRLKAQAIFYNPNRERGRLKKIKVDIYVNGKKVGTVDQEMKITIPSRGEFTVPLEVNLAMKELGFMDTLMGMLGGKKLDVRYQGFLKLTYKGFPVKVPVDYKDEIRVRF
ncbi:MAG TPA: LEA type 2 family protein [Ohtaekwangia sp.]|nr:LEA type 2 family protein [Ohtaekwangia sp.]